VPSVVQNCSVKKIKRLVRQCEWGGTFLMDGAVCVLSDFEVALESPVAEEPAKGQKRRKGPKWIITTGDESFVFICVQWGS